MRRGFLSLAIFMIIGHASCSIVLAQYPRQQVLTVTALDKAGYRHSIMVGYHEAATHGFDVELQEVAIPPIPAVQTYDFRILDHPSRPRVPASGSYRELLPFPSHAIAPPDSFLVRAQASDNAWPMIVYWDLSSASRFQQAVLVAGNQRIDMTQASSLTVEEDTSSRLLILLTPNTSSR